ncbi:MAG: AAA family ATPase, partial [Rhodobacteraceae bacterium]|nr:AAA family ATPase [Paracoccaceae bacterium]
KSLRQDNPWWAAGNYHVSGIDWKRTHFSPFAELTLNWNIKRSVIVMGLRRVGKTVMLYQLIEWMIQNGFNSERILYLSVDTPLYSGMPLQRCWSF